MNPKHHTTLCTVTSNWQITNSRPPPMSRSPFIGSMPAVRCPTADSNTASWLMWLFCQWRPAGNDLLQPLHAALRRHPAPANMSRKTLTSHTVHEPGLQLNMRSMDETHRLPVPSDTRVRTVYTRIGRFLRKPLPHVTTGSSFTLHTWQRKRWRISDTLRRIA